MVAHPEAFNDLEFQTCREDSEILLKKALGKIMTTGIPEFARRGIGVSIISEVSH